MIRRVVELSSWARGKKSMAEPLGPVDPANTTMVLAVTTALMVTSAERMLVVPTTC